MKTYLNKNQNWCVGGGRDEGKSAQYLINRQFTTWPTLISPGCPLKLVQFRFV